MLVYILRNTKDVGEKKLGLQACLACDVASCDGFHQWHVLVSVIREAFSDMRPCGSMVERSTTNRKVSGFEPQLGQDYIFELLFLMGLPFPLTNNDTVPEQRRYHLSSRLAAGDQPL